MAGLVEQITAFMAGRSTLAYGVIFLIAAAEALPVLGEAPFAQAAHFRLQPDPSKDGPDIARFVPSKDRPYQPNGPVVDVIDPHSSSIV